MGQNKWNQKVQRTEVMDSLAGTWKIIGCFNVKQALSLVLHTLLKQLKSQHRWPLSCNKMHAKGSDRWTGSNRIRFAVAAALCGSSETAFTWYLGRQWTMKKRIIRTITEARKIEIWRTSSEGWAKLGWDLEGANWDNGKETEDKNEEQSGNG